MRWDGEGRGTMREGGEGTGESMGGGGERKAGKCLCRRVRESNRKETLNGMFHDRNS